jgi:hypothetical protein
MRNLSMKKFGTPIGAAPGIASEKVGLSSVGEPSGARPRPWLRFRDFFLRTVRSTSPVIRLASILPARKVRLRLRPSRVPVEPEPAPASPESAPPTVRLGAPGPSLPSGVGVDVTDGTVGTAAGGVGVGVETGPWSMTSLMGPETPGIWTEPTDAPGGTSTVVWMRTPVTRTTVTECSWAAAGSAAKPRPTTAAASAKIPFRPLM